MITVDEYWVLRGPAYHVVYMEVFWDGRPLSFQRTKDDKVWRIVRATPTGTETTPEKSARRTE